MLYCVKKNVGFRPVFTELLAGFIGFLDRGQVQCDDYTLAGEVMAARIFFSSSASCTVKSGKCSRIKTISAALPAASSPAALDDTSCAPIEAETLFRE